MNTEKTYSISFIGLKNGEHTFEYQIDSDFFKNYDYDDFNRIQANISVLLNKKATHLEVNFKAKGVVNVPCDVTNEDFDLPIENEFNLIVKFGEEFNDDHDEILIIPMNEYEITLTQYIYELIVLSIPAKRVSPEAREDEDFDEEDFDFLFDDEEEDSEMDETPEEETEGDSDQNDIDPRWEKLKKLLTDK
ncbi:YceD family protein [Myroides sp. DW712]|uniref:YceD family protein n=1 Tax=Myroides sp. DW712 TaxID=3389800 RepID=UPI00397B0871